MRTLSRMLAVCMVMLPLISNAQPKTAPSWSARFKTSINWQRVHSLGYLIVSTNDGLYGVNPNDGKIIWENKGFAALNPEYYLEVEGTEFLTIAYRTESSTTIPMQAIIDVGSGKVLFDSQKEQIGVLSRHVLPESGRLLVIGVKPKTLSASLFMYDIASGQQLWSNDEMFKADAGGGKGFLGKLQAMGQQLSNLQSLTSEPLELRDGSIVITHPNYVIRVQTADGKVVWKNSIQPSVRAEIHFSPYKKGVVYVGTDVESDQGSGFSSSSSQNQGQPQKFYTNLYYAFDLQNGNPLWKEPAKENDNLNQIIIHEKGIIICPRSSQKPTINLVDYETGKTIWGNKGKGIKAQGSVVSYIPTEKGLLITTAFDNAWNNKAEEFYLNILDPISGTLKYEKSIKLKGDIVRTELVPKGLLFITTKEVNILDTNTGALVWANSIEAGNTFNSDKVRPFPTGDSGDGKMFVYSPKEKGVFEIDKQAGTFKKITSAKIEFEGKEMPHTIDVVKDGLVLSSDQNVMKLGFDGLVKFFKYYPAPRQPALVRALLAAQAVRAAYIGAAASAYSAAFAQASQKTTDPAGKAVGQELSRAFGELGQAGFAYSAQAMKAFNARFKASMNTPSFIMMMTTQEKKGNQLVQINKENGDVTSAVDIKNDREPEYDVDQIYNYVYYRPNGSEIVCYKL
ncbi:MAG: PQQ-binding-like beta-propeller repeat protein [Cyclobacteriaceae bacterium]